MSGSVYFTALVVVIFAALAVVLSPVFLVPAVLLVLFAVFAGPLMAVIRGTGGRSAGGTPTTSEASYDPVSAPEERTV
jgi:hypothetical protein